MSNVIRNARFPLATDADNISAAMADKPEKPKPTYEALEVENAALRARAGLLEAEIGRRDADADVANMKLKRAKMRRMLDPKAKSPLDRPWDGR